MPGIDYKHTLGRARFATGRRYYDGSTAERTTVPCPVCRLPADPVIGDHTGDPRCLAIGRENRDLRAELARQPTRRFRKKDR